MWGSGQEGGGQWGGVFLCRGEGGQERGRQRARGGDFYAEGVGEVGQEGGGQWEGEFYDGMPG